MILELRIKSIYSSKSRRNKKSTFSRKKYRMPNKHNKNNLECVKKMRSKKNFSIEQITRNEGLKNKVGSPKLNSYRNPGDSKSRHQTQ
jgi:molybdate-binding protein